MKVGIDLTSLLFHRGVSLGHQAHALGVPGGPGQGDPANGLGE